jgi:hypothetical protein
MMRCRWLIISMALPLLVAGCGRMVVDEVVNWSVNVLAPLQQEIRAPILRETADGCAVDLYVTNSIHRRMSIVVRYRAVGSDGRELPPMEVSGVLATDEAKRLHGDVTHGVACSDVAELVPRDAHLEALRR